LAEDTGYSAPVAETDSQKETDSQGATPPQEMEGNLVQLTPTEEREVRKRSSLRAAVVFETVRREGETEIARPFLALAFSGLAAGLSMGFSLVGTGILSAYTPAAQWKPLFENLGYTLGFLIVVLGRQQLFTENTLTAILPVLDDPDKVKKLGQMLRLWAIVLTTNLIGAAIFAEFVAKTSMFPPVVRAAFLAIALHTVHPGFGEIVARGVLAGWLIALMVWLLPAADTQRVWVILILTYIVGAAGLSHIIAGSVEALYAVAAGVYPWTQYVSGFLVPVFIGNCIGGVALVAVLNYGQIAPESSEAQRDDA
jgi:formate/nitrite transporter FocA (FNT family)